MGVKLPDFDRAAHLVLIAPWVWERPGLNEREGLFGYFARYDLPIVTNT